MDPTYPGGVHSAGVPHIGDVRSPNERRRCPHPTEEPRMSAETSVTTPRKVDRGDLAPGCPAHAGADGVWHVQDYATARALLRHTDTRQAGFGAEHTARMERRMRVPVLY